MIGIDFGTTNSAIALAGAGEVQLAEFHGLDGPTNTFRSVLYFDPENFEETGKPRAATGHDAIRRYLETHGAGRLMQSLKSHLASKLFKETYVFEYPFSLEELIAVILRDLRTAAIAQLGGVGGTVVIGRPVHFVRSGREDGDDLAVERMTRALRWAGFDNVEFELEPVAAAYHYENGLDHDELILIGDFGGGTSDFCLLPVGPAPRARGGRREILGTEGVGIAGDAFDSKIVRHVVAPKLGYGSRYRGAFGDEFTIPSWIFSNFERWHMLTFLRSQKTMTMLHALRAQAKDGAMIDALIRMVEDDVGFDLYRAVEQTKRALSAGDETTFRFASRGVSIEVPVKRRDFEDWIAPDLEEIAGCVDRLLENANVSPHQVDRVFLTGGSSFVPAVRTLFEWRFGPDRIRSGNELTSVASGLALRSREISEMRA